MKRYLTYILSIFIMVACSPEVTGNIDAHPEIFPDYREVTIPSNIAPMKEPDGWQ